MNINNLLGVLKEQEKNIKEYVDISSFRQKALINNNLKEIQDLLVKEENLLSQINEEGKNISNVIENLSLEYSLDLKFYSVKDFVNAVKSYPEVINPVSLLQKSIKELISKAIYINEQNKYLIEHSRNFIRETVLNLVALNNNQLLDRKI